MFGRRSKAKRFTDEMTRQAKNAEFVRSEPLAMQLTVVHNEGSGWKWLCFTYDPDGARMLAGAVEGVLVPHGMKDGYGTRDEALIEGIVAIRKGGWNGDVVIHEKEPSASGTPLGRGESDDGGAGGRSSMRDTPASTP